ncbi:DUF3014 domain-containing protein [Methylosarcina fibrata]|uniref:DUF3014 domain-containing protein n=1 Tax=Methylosarcina fibrata TaxID=105972 RepID=UPI000377CF3A|nr:DUF3014 domain-containing protein [Methylosarcina fibrata]
MRRYRQTQFNSGRYHPVGKKKSRGLPALMIIVFLILLVAGWIYFSLNFNGKQTVRPMEHETQSLPLPPESDVPDMAEGGPEPVPENVPADSEQEEAALPALDDSDGFVREELLKLSPSLLPWFDTPQMLRKFLRIVNDFSQGSRLEKHMRFLKPAQPFAVAQDADGLFIAPAGYHRYDALAAAIAAVDEQAALALYKKVRPLLLEIYAEFGYPEGYQLEDLFRKAAAEMISAPIITERIAVVRPSVLYKFADPALEALNPVHKQMLRLGPENTRIIQNKVRRLAEAMGGQGD